MQLIRMTKPTGDAECPPEVERAHYIESLISEKVESRELNDSDITDHVDTSDNDTLSSDSDESDDSDKENLDPASNRRRQTRRGRQSRKTITKQSLVQPNPPTARAVRVEQPLPLSTQPRTRPSQAANALDRISNHMVDMTARKDDFALQSQTMMQTFAMASQNRELSSTLNIVRGALSDTERRLNEERSRADRLEHQIALLRMETRLRDERRSDSRHGRSRRPPSPFVSPGHWYEATFRSGGQRRWFSRPGEDPFDFDDSASIRSVRCLDPTPDDTPSPVRSRRTSPPRPSDFIQGSSSRPIIAVTPRRHVQYAAHTTVDEVVPMEEDELDESN